MNLLSVVIITYNEEYNIAACIHSARLVSNDIIIVDCGSKDRTIQIAEEQGARCFTIDWKTYGFSRNFGALKAKNDWILALDADERMSKPLAASILAQNFTDHQYIYKFRRENFLEGKKIRFGSLGNETVKRIYHRQSSAWDLTRVHEKLVGEELKQKLIRGNLLHYGLKDCEDYRSKALNYAWLSAEKYFLQGRKINLFKQFSSPIFNSVKSYIFQLGFLDGKKGFLIARTIAWYSWLKYFYLLQLVKEAKNKNLSFSIKPNVKAAS